MFLATYSVIRRSETPQYRSQHERCHNVCAKTTHHYRSTALYDECSVYPEAHNTNDTNNVIVLSAQCHVHTYIRVSVLYSEPVYVCVCRSFMGDPLPYQLKDARTAEQYAKWRMMELSSSTTQTHTHDHHSSSGEEFNPRPGAMLTYEAPSTKFPVLEQNGAQLHQLQTSGPHHRGYADSPAHPQGQVPQNGAVQMVSEPHTATPSQTGQTV